MYDYYAIT